MRAETTLVFIPGSWLDDAGDVYLFVAIAAAVLSAGVLIIWSRSARRRRSNR
jgi:hypothetical protein